MEQKYTAIMLDGIDPSNGLCRLVDVRELTQEELDALLDSGWTMEEIIEEATK